MRTSTCTPVLQRSEQKKRPLSTEVAEWINTLPWSHYGTFTTRYMLTMKTAREKMERYFDFIKKDNKDARLLWVAEPFDVTKGYHTHGLIYIGGSNAINSKSEIFLLKDAWRIVSNGSRGKKDTWTKIDPYVIGLGAHYYVAKYIGRKDVDWELMF